MKGAAISLAGVAAVGLVGCSKSTAAPVEEGISWDHETDIIIVGLGGAGAAAAYEAGAAGADVIALELAAEPGGSTNICGGLVNIGGGNALQKAAGFEDSVDNYYNFLVKAVGLGADEEQIRVFAEKSPELYTWLTETIGVKFKPGYSPKWPDPVNMEAGLTCTGDEFSNDYADVSIAIPRTGWVEGEGIPQGALTGQKNGSGFFQPLLRAVKAMSNIHIMAETAGEELIYDQDKQRVLGVKAKQGEKAITVKARKAVILTAGGFAINKDMMKNYCPAYSGTPALGTRGDNGVGIKMGQAVGADTRNMHSAYTTLSVSSYLSQASGAGGPLSQGILVSQFGTRFIAEDHYYSYTPDYMLQNHYRAKYNPSYAIIDSQILADIPEASLEKFKSFISAEANSIEELAKKLGTPEGALENTLNFYNAGAAKGKDVVFNKQTKYMTPITKAPFYALTVKPSTSTFTTGGLRINTDCQVISSISGQPIAGLYSAGRNASNVMAQQYGGSGISVATCFVFGRIAGQKAAAETSWV
ncbi:putative fumarate reductase flavoprotein subunit [Desulfitobacterium hafniense Y51]|uniref:Putative fumarate reductase flavoprotein subunit n=1 Tax=Desulfitobacterium hafniense (strain Y51) TaxID=138119 RepID=Q24QV0_DESHY|nr:putative fumarate reductase flavoprotein subunit [Desulfitobacterium hafniense Y51]